MDTLTNKSPARFHTDTHGYTHTNTQQISIFLSTHKLEVSVVMFLIRARAQLYLGDLRDAESFLHKGS